MIGAQPAACLAALGSIALAPRVSYWVLFVAMLAARAVSRRRYFANQLALGLALNVFWDRQRDRVKRPQLSDKAGRERQYRHEHHEQQVDGRDAPGRISQYSVSGIANTPSLSASIRSLAHVPPLNHATSGGPFHGVPRAGHCNRRPTAPSAPKRERR
jgi:hypothetical protein